MKIFKIICLLITITQAHLALASSTCDEGSASAATAATAQNRLILIEDRAWATGGAGVRIVEDTPEFRAAGN